MILFFVIILTIYFLCLGTGIFVEKKQWNKGLCKRCGTPFQYSGLDLQGSRRYCCNKCNYDLSISFPFVDNLNRNVPKE